MRAGPTFTSAHQKPTGLVNRRTIAQRHNTQWTCARRTNTRHSMRTNASGAQASNFRSARNLFRRPGQRILPLADSRFHYRQWTRVRARAAEKARRHWPASGMRKCGALAGVVWQRGALAAKSFVRASRAPESAPTVDVITDCFQPTINCKNSVRLCVCVCGAARALRQAEWAEFK